MLPLPAAGPLMATLASPLRAVLVDSRAERRSLMRLLVEGDGTSTSVVGEADSADAALVVVDAERADVAVVEIRMPAAEGLRAVRELSRWFPRIGIVVCSFDIDKATEMDALAEGAHALLAKPASRHHMRAALDAACAAALDADIPMATPRQGTPDLRAPAGVRIEPRRRVEALLVPKPAAGP